MNFCTETVFPMPATPLVSTVLMGRSCPGDGLKMSLELIGLSSVSSLLEDISVSPCSPSVM